MSVEKSDTPAAPRTVVEQPPEEVAEGAPVTETPEDQEQRAETPEQPAAPPVEVEEHAAIRRTLTDATTPGTGPRLLELDTGVAVAPATRPSAFSPPGTAGTLPAPSDALDYGQSSQMADRVNTFDEPPTAAGVSSPSPGY